MAQAQLNSAARFRTRKISIRQNLPVHLASEIELDEDQQRGVLGTIETGIEHQEESETHLQAAIVSQAAAVSSKVKRSYIPTPDASGKFEKYNDYYPKAFSEPISYIRFSDTVEDSAGVPYCLDEEDASFLESINAGKLAVNTQCSEDTFETITQHFEELISEKQPFLSMDPTQVLPYEEMESSFDERNYPASYKSFAKQIYPHWRQRKVARLGKSIMPSLRPENTERDEADPYVCFRRREIRQVRKTRRTDAQSSEKLKRLRKEMLQAKQLVELVAKRERLRKENLSYEESIFNQRCSVKNVKRKLGIKGDDEDLVSHKRKRPSESVNTSIRLPARIDGRAVEADLVTLEEMIREKAESTKAAIDERIATRMIQSEDWEDVTESFQDISHPRTNYYRSIKTFYLPTPSLSPEISEEIAFPTANDPTYSITLRSRPMFRRRMGRGGRVMLDRIRVRKSTKGISPELIDRFKYDRSDSEEDFMEINTFNNISSRYRALHYPLTGLSDSSGANLNSKPSQA